MRFLFNCFLGHARIEPPQETSWCLLSILLVAVLVITQRLAHKCLALRRTPRLHCSRRGTGRDLLDGSPPGAHSVPTGTAVQLYYE